MARQYEDFAVGTRFETGTRSLSRDDIVSFARDYDPQPFHLGEDSAAGTPLGELIASGWQTAAVTMRLLVDAGFFGETLGMGIDELRWLRPVRPGDTLRVAGEVESMRPSATKPIGIIRVRMRTINQRDEDVLSMISIVQAKRRT